MSARHTQRERRRQHAHNRTLYAVVQQTVKREANEEGEESIKSAVFFQGEKGISSTAS